MKRFLIIMGALALSSALCLAEEITHPMVFKDDVNFDRGCVWKIDSTKVTSSATELNIMDGCTATAAQLNLSGSSYTAATNAQVTATNAYKIATNAYQYATNGLALVTATNAQTIATNAYRIATNGYQVATNSYEAATNAQANANIALTNWTARVDTTEIVATNAQANANILLTNTATFAQGETADIAVTNWTARMEATEIVATNAQTKVTPLLGSIAMSVAYNNITNCVVSCQAKTVAGVNPGATYFAHLWITTNLLTQPDASAWDLANGITCGTVVTNSTDDFYHLLTDADGKISWAGISTAGTPATNYVYCNIGGVPIGVVTVPLAVP